MNRTQKKRFLAGSLRNVMWRHIAIVVDEGEDQTVFDRVCLGLGAPVRERVRDEVRDNVNSAIEEKLKAQR